MATIIKIEVTDRAVSAEGRQSIRALTAAGVNFLVEMANGVTYTVAGIFDGKISLFPANCNTDKVTRGMVLDFPA